VRDGGIVPVFGWASGEKSAQFLQCRPSSAAQTAGRSAASLLYFLAELNEFSKLGKRMER
jgi:hypothetical protein